jgi:hypothetical protein
MCGGVTARLAIYEDPTYPVADYSPSALLAGYSYQGCYTEPGDYRAVTFRQGQLDFGALTIEQCLTTCGQGSYPYAAVEWSGECYCGTRLISGSVQAPSADCSYTCNGNRAQMCGGSERLGLYYASKFVSTQPCGYVPPASSGACNGTAYGYVEGKSTTFVSLGIGSNWGWVVQGALPITGQLYLGAGGNDLTKGTVVGSFTIARTGNTVTVTYTTNSPYVIQEDHFYSCAVTTDSFSLPYSSSKNTYIIHASIGNPMAPKSCSS